MDPELSAIIMTILIYTALSATLIICKATKILKWGQFTDLTRYAGVLYFWKKKLIRTNSQIERDILDNSLQEDSLSGKIEKVYKRENELNEPLLPENLYSKKDGLTLSNLIKDLTVLGSGSVSKHQKAPEESQRVTFSSDGKGKASTFQKAFHKYKLNRIKEAKKENNFYKLKGFWAFIKGIFLINDKVMSNACSNDAYIYLLYLKWCAMSLFFLSLIGVLLLCPFYYFSSDHENKTLRGR